MLCRSRMTAISLLVVAAISGLAGCKSRGEIVINEGVGVTAVRSRCPAVGVPDFTGDVTLFSVSGNTTAGNIDVVAAMTKLRPQCTEGVDKVISRVTFDVLARRSNVQGARQVTLPYFVTVLRGGNTVITKRVGSVTLNFSNGEERAQASGEGIAYIDRASATLPEDIRRRVTRKRKAGDADAAVDPLADPEVKAAIARATFELLVGFQLEEAQLAYNATR